MGQAKIDTMEDPRWEYVDRQSNIQGKFTTLQMQQWASHGMLPENLRIRCHDDAGFIPMDAFFTGKDPFKYPPLPLPIVPPRPLPRPKLQREEKESSAAGKGAQNKKNGAGALQPNGLASASASASSSSPAKNAKSSKEGGKMDKYDGYVVGHVDDGKNRSAAAAAAALTVVTGQDNSGWHAWNGWNQMDQENIQAKLNSVLAADPRKYQYLDIQDVVQGPFDHLCMMRWKEAKILPTWLKVRLFGTEEWKPLEDVLGNKRKRRMELERNLFERIFDQREGQADPPICWSVVRTVKETDGCLWEEKWISPLRIRFSQKEIHPFFHHRGSIEEVLSEIVHKSIEQNDDDHRPPLVELHPPFPPIRVVELCNQQLNEFAVSLDNRRLYALQRVALDVWPKIALVKVWSSPWARLPQKKLKSEWRKFSHGKDGGVAALICSRSSEWETWDWRIESALLEKSRFPQIGLLPVVNHPRAELKGQLSFSLLPLFFFCYLCRSDVQKKIIPHFPLLFHIAKVFGRPMLSKFHFSHVLQKHIEDLLYRRAFKTPKVGIPYTAKATVKVTREGTKVEVHATLGKGGAPASAANGAKHPTPIATPYGSQTNSPRGEVCAVEPGSGAFLTPSQLAFTIFMLPWSALPVAFASKTTICRRRLAICLLSTYGYVLMWRGHKWLSND